MLHNGSIRFFVSTILSGVLLACSSGEDDNLDNRETGSDRPADTLNIAKSVTESKVTGSPIKRHLSK